MNICWLTTLGSIAAAGGSLLASMQDELFAHLATQPMSFVHILVKVRPFMDRHWQACSKNWHGIAGYATLLAVIRVLLVAAPGYSTMHICAFFLLLNPITRILLVTMHLDHAFWVLPRLVYLTNHHITKLQAQELLCLFYNWIAKARQTGFYRLQGGVCRLCSWNEEADKLLTLP